jgi:arginine/lysine/ornithine decarboxylase
VAPHRRAGRRRRRRPQLPQVDPARDHHDRLDPGLPEADAQPLRHHRPIAQGEFTPESIRAKIAAHPLLSGVDAARVKPRILTLTQSTYDGVLYNTETIKHALDGYVDTLHFDEAWLPHAAFHKFYGTFHAMGKSRPRPKDQLVFATQSTHKLLAGISQASQVLVQDSQTRKLDPHLFNEAYLMHSSTSPQYAIIASCDVSAAMMEAPGGTALVEESIAESLDFRRAMRKVDGEFGKDWWFKVWGPERLAADGIGTSADWMLKSNAKWHGFGDLADGFNLLDPIKCTVITPGSTCRASSPRPASRRRSSPSSSSSTASSSRRPGSTRSSSCSRSASPRVDGTRW